MALHLFLPIAFVMTSTQTKPDPAVLAAVRKEIEAGYSAWGAARVAYDKPTFEKMLTSDFYILNADQTKMTRQEFLDLISDKTKGLRLGRFESQVQTLTQQGDKWVAVITEKLEAAGTAANGKKVKAYALWVTRDGWRKDGDQWKVMYSEEIGSQAWFNTAPPVRGWSS